MRTTVLCRGWLAVVTLFLSGWLLILARPVGADDVSVDLSGYRADCGITVKHAPPLLVIAWPLGNGEFGRLTLDTERQPLVPMIGVGKRADDEPAVLLQNVDAAFWLTVGSRNVPPGKPPEQTWQVFFDKPASRPHQAFAVEWQRGPVVVTSQGRRATVTLGRVKAGSFVGDLRFTLYADCPLIHVEAVVSTNEDRRAILYDAGLVGNDAEWRSFAWLDTKGQLQRIAVSDVQRDRHVAVRHRAIVAEASGGSVSAFPPPHQFFFPTDWSDNFKFTWCGKGHPYDAPAVAGKGMGFGIRQDKTQRGAFVPWSNAPPGTQQRLGVFYLVTRGDAAKAISETLRFTHGDRFPELPGYLTMTSHWHMAVAVTAMEQHAKGIDPLPVPDFVRMFKDMGVNMVHLGEFHGDGHQQDPGPLRLPELDWMFRECRRLSDDKLLLIPGEEVNTFLGLQFEGKHPGHWMSLFPKPVYWTMRREANQPFVEEHPQFGKVYRVGGRADMIRLIRDEGALVWAAHPRIKASSWTPDIFRNEDFFVADSWLGGAWKAMPADLSEPRLGRRVLDLQDDMANWGHSKYVLGEVDVFKLDHTHELYGHMNVNYLRLDCLPRFENGWQSVLDALRSGEFFVTTGEVLIPDFRIGDRSNGEVLKLRGDKRVKLTANIRATFPLNFAEIISGDGTRVHRERIDLTHTRAFDEVTLARTLDLTNRRWVRLEVWDCAINGAFTPPVWIWHEESS